MAKEDCFLVVLGLSCFFMLVSSGVSYVQAVVVIYDTFR